MPKQNQLGSVHTLIHIGCGANPNIDEYISLAENVWLIDADTEVIAKLEEITQAQENDAYKNVHTRQALADIEQCKATFYRYSLSWANGITPIDEKTQHLYPGLKCLSSEEHTTTAIATLVKECLLPTEQENIDNHMLLLSCGHQNEPLLQSLEVSNVLCRFRSVVVLPAHRQHKPIAVPPTLYTTIQSSQELTLPSNSQILVEHPLIKVIKDLKEEAAKDRQKLEHQLLDNRQQLAERDQRLAELNDERNQTQEVLKGNRQTLEQSRQAEKIAYYKRDEEAKRAEQTASQKDALLAELKEMQWRVEKIQTEHAGLEAEHIQLQLDYKEQQRSAHLSTKLLTKIEADASDLRDRYAKLVESEQELRNLISELHSKLEAASRFYKQLSRKHPELLEEL